MLAQRNALLARIRAGRASRGVDRHLGSRAGARRRWRSARTARRRWRCCRGPFARRARRPWPRGEAGLEYRPRSRAADEEEFVAELAERLPGDLERGFTGHGPHRDELALLRDGRELRVYGSQGEQRLALLALLLCERAVLAEKRAARP